MNASDATHPDDLDMDVETRGERMIFRWRGAFDPARHRRQALAVMRLCQHRRCTRALIDVRDQTGEMSLTDRFDLARDLAEVWDRNIRVALLDHADRVLPDRFFETTVNNRGPLMKTFTDEAEALAWL